MKKAATSETRNSKGVHSDLIRGNVDTIILKCLNIGGEMYGLEIINYIKKASYDTYVLKQPTLYSALRRLEEKGHISSYWRDSAIGGRRHYYKLTEPGQQSLPTRKDQWSASKEVIDTLVDGKPLAKTTSSSKKPVIPADDSEINTAVAAAALPNTVTMGMAINPYNPYTESGDEYLTLPFRIAMENEELAVIEQQVVPQQQNLNIPLETQEYAPPPLRYVMADEAFAPVPEVNTFAKYLSPDEYAAMSSVKTGAAAKTAKIANYDIQIRPFTKHYMDKKRGDFHFTAKLRLLSAFVLTLVLTACLIVAYHSLKESYTSNEKSFFILGAVAVGLYFVYYLVRFLANPQSKKALQGQLTEQMIRLGAFIGAVITILAINVLAGLTHVNSPEYLVFWVVPCILVATIFVEGILQFLLRKANLFVA